MTVNLGDYKSFTVDDFSGGLNEFASPYKIADNEIVSCKNVSLRDSGAIKSALGYAYGNSQGPTYNVYGVKGAHRYTSSDGTRNVILYGSDSNEGSSGLYVSNADSQFDKVGEILSDDGYCRFAQYRDTIFASTLGGPVEMYDGETYSGKFSEIFIQNVWTRYYSLIPETGEQVFTRPDSLLEVSTEDGDGNIDEGVYYYRFTVDYGGKDFVGESSPIVMSSSHYQLDALPVYTEYMEDTITIDGATADDDVVFKKPTNAFPLQYDVQRINIYKSIPLTSAIAHSNKKRVEVFFVGSISRSKYTSASEGDTLFVDGGVVPGPLAEYGKMVIPPRARFITYHKSGMWSANVSYETGTTDGRLAGENPIPDIIKKPHSVMFSDVNNHGNSEPMVYRPDFSIEVDPTDGEGITGMRSYRNSLLIVFKANSTWAITGDSASNFSLRNIDPTIGCVAPETIDVVDGRLVWLSNAGMYYFDGSRVLPFMTDNIRKSLDAIPAKSKPRAAGIYDVGRREYLLAHAGSSNYSGSKNHLISRISMRNNSWAQEEREFATNMFIQQKMPDEAVKTLACSDYTLGNSITNPAMISLDKTFTTIDGSAISFSFQTKFFDGNSPHMNKNFKAVLFELQTPVDLTLDVVCDNRMDTRLDDGGSFTITKPVTNDMIWADDGVAPFTPARSDQQKWYEDGVNTNIWAEEQESGVLVLLDDRCWGKRISLIVSGSVRSQVEIQSLTVFYLPVKGVRQ